MKMGSIKSPHLRSLDKIYVIVILTIVISVSIFLRFYNITDKGLWAWDSAYYANIAKGPILAARWLVANFDGITQSKVSSADLKEYLFNRGVSGYPGVKPGHTLLMALSFAILGIEDYAALMMSAFFGVLIVLLTFKVGNDFFDPKVGLAAAAVLAVSGNQVFFSRSGFPQTDTVFFTLLGTYCYLLSDRKTSRGRWLASSGACFGLALIMHASALPIVVIVGLAEMFRVLRHRPILPLEMIKVGSFFLVPVLAPFLLAEGIIRLFFQFFADWVSVGTTSQATFWGWIVYQAGGILPSGDYTLELLPYPRSLWELEGPVVLMLVLIGLILILRRIAKERMFQDSLMVGEFLGPLLFWVFNGAEPRLKAIQVTLPAMALLAGVGIMGIVDTIHLKLRRPRLAAAVLALILGLILFWGTATTIGLVRLKAGYREAARQAIAYMRQNGGKMTIDQGSVGPLWMFYLGQLYEQIPESLRESLDLETLGDQGDFVVLDFRRYFKPDKHAKLMDMASRCDPVIVVPNPMGRKPIRFWIKQSEALRSRSAETIRQPDADLILLYDLRRCGETSK